jgi:hypothetical protein
MGERGEEEEGGLKERDGHGGKVGGRVEGVHRGGGGGVGVAEVVGLDEVVQEGRRLWMDHRAWRGCWGGVG